MKSRIRIIIQVALGLLAVGLIYGLYESIMEPVRFNKEKDRRTAVVVQRLKDIRSVQMAYKSAFGKYINDIDSLVLFLEDGQLPYIKKIGNVPDSLTEMEAIALKIVSRDTAYENAYTVLFPNVEDKAKHLKNLKYVPFTDNTKKMTLSAGFIDKSGYKIPVFEASVRYELFLEDLDKQQVRNLVSAREDLDKFPGLMVGSMKEAMTEGNWE